MPNETKEPKTYTEEQYAELQREKDIAIRDLRKELRETTAALEDHEGKVSDLQGQITALEAQIKDFNLDADSEARVKRITKGEGELAKRTTEYNRAKKLLEAEAKPIKEAKLKQLAGELAGKSQGQFTVEQLLAQGDETNMRDYWQDHYDPATAKPPENPPGQKNDGGDKKGLPGLPPGGGSPPPVEKTAEDKLKERYPTMHK